LADIIASSLFLSVTSDKISSVKQVLTFLTEVKLELSKVTWPKRSEVIKLTAIVFIISGLVGAYTGALDFIFTKLLEFFVAK
jgi:preprotein translocase subunit SecE